MTAAGVYHDDLKKAGTDEREREIAKEILWQNLK
jgi:hypothetical protein